MTMGAGCHLSLKDTTNQINVERKKANKMKLKKKRTITRETIVSENILGKPHSLLNISVFKQLFVPTE